MTNPDPFRTYLQELQRNLSTGSATEHTHRSALQALLEALGDGVQAINEPQRVECGAPDYILTRAGTPIGYVEAKDIGTSLDTAERSEQLSRYRASLNNLILTDYLEFRWYVEGEHRETARLATVTQDGKVKRSRGGAQAVSDLLQKFFAQEVPTLGRPKELAERMAALARMTRNLIEETSEVSKDLGGLTPSRVYINKTQYFEGVEPDVWAFQIGGHQVLHKWLKDRRAANYPLMTSSTTRRLSWP